MTKLTFCLPAAIGVQTLEPNLKLANQVTKSRHSFCVSRVIDCTRFKPNANFNFFIGRLPVLLVKIHGFKLV